MAKKTSPQHAEERENLPEHLRLIFDQLVAEYKFACLKHYGRELVSYKVLADLVRDGWKPQLHVRSDLR
jgi:hypothetical protein